MSAVCHGPGGLFNVRLSVEGYPIAGKKLTGFSWVEEQLVKRDEAVSFSLEDVLQERGADYDKALNPFASHVVEDGRLITDQTPKARTRLSIKHRSKIKEVIQNWPVKDLHFICVSTGGRIMGLGDIGTNGMGS